MTCENEDNAVAALLPVLEVLTGGDDDRFRDALQLLLNAAMRCWSGSTTCGLLPMNAPKGEMVTPTASRIVLS